MGAGKELRLEVLVTDRHALGEMDGQTHGPGLLWAFFKNTM